MNIYVCVCVTSMKAYTLTIFYDLNKRWKWRKIISSIKTNVNRSKETITKAIKKHRKFIT